MMKCDMMRYSIVIPVLNQLDYTSQCVDSLLQCGTSPKSLLIINNGSSDGTASWLTAHPQIPSITNEVNLGCGGA
ncbi:MAG TPA: glycosyltransferase, partial [Nitrospirota bacterium]|nr:glycosyltransferase [Nitrospirota bacterium]